MSTDAKRYWYYVIINDDDATMWKMWRDNYEMQDQMAFQGKTFYAVKVADDDREQFAIMWAEAMERYDLFRFKAEYGEQPPRNFVDRFTAPKGPQ
jgi:hypothetical protein